MPEHNTPTESEQLALLLGNNGLRSEPDTPRTHLVSIRVPQSEFVKIQAMTSLADIPRSGMINRLLRVGIQAVIADLDPDAAERLDVAIEHYSEQLENR